MKSLTCAEAFTVGLLGLFAVLWLLLPHIAQPESYHHFADQRAALGIPHAADVLSNLPMGLSGLLGLYQLRRGLPELSGLTQTSLALFFAGLVLTCFGSVFYHWNPSDSSLVWDRLPMVITFAGVLGALATQRISQRMGKTLLALGLLLGIGSIWLWRWSGDLALYAIVQFGGFAGVLLTLLLTRTVQDPLPWWQLILWYGLAKLFEAWDMQIWHLTDGVLAGHTLKHLAAGAAGLAMLRPLRAHRS
jgi:predicted membrane channel-forming protein YqfA (hemolysin III family)